MEKAGFFLDFLVSESCRKSVFEKVVSGGFFRYNQFRAYMRKR